jgi:hypothetical protein
MSAEVNSRRWASWRLFALLTSLALVVLWGCGKDEVVDPYVYAPLGAVMEGDTLSTGFLFEIDAPQFEYVRGPVAVVRKGNRLEFLVGDKLEDRYPSLSGTLLGVQKAFTPQPTHLVLQRIKRGGTVVEDSLPRPEYGLPRLLRAGAVDLETPGAPLPEMSWRRSESIERFLPEEEGDPLLQIQSPIDVFVNVPRHDLPDSLLANPRPEDMAWYAVFPDATVLIEDLTPGAEWMLEMLKAKDYPLIGSFSMKELYDRRVRRVDNETLGHIVGAMKVNWFRFGNTFVEGAERD